jgi:large subunit ribosomal protein L27e
MKFIKTGRIVILTGGRYAGKKGLVVKTFDEGTKARSFAHALIAGVAKAPLKVTKKMGKKKVEKRTKCKSFVKYVNYNHIMPTRYVVPTDFDAKSLVTDAQMDTAETKQAARKSIKKIFDEKFTQTPTDKAGKISKDILYMKKKLRF